MAQNTHVTLEGTQLERVSTDNESETMEDTTPINDLDSSSLIRTERRWLRELSAFAQGTRSRMSSPPGETKKLGVFEGVFCPVALSMFSSLLFLRVGYVVGNAGILQSMLQLFISYTIIVCTVLSICAVATNGAVQGGGVYFMISRTLGPELGGSVGILFYLANVVGSALYATGASEGMISNFGPKGILKPGILPDGEWWLFLYEWTFNWMNIIVGIVGAALFGRTSATMLVVVSLCAFTVIASFFQDVSIQFHYNETVYSNCTVNCTYDVINGSFTGLSHTSWEQLQELVHNNLLGDYGRDCESRDTTVSFMTVFGVLFSGVTGIMAGANLSGELKNPAKAIPKGTLSAVSYTFFVYFTLFLLTALTCDRNFLYHDCLYMTQVEFWKPFVSIGALVATFCASLSGLIGASRVLQAVAKDTMFGPFLQFILKGTFGDNPVAAVIFTGILSGMCFFVGSLNKIAQLCSVLFLLSYATINLACLGLDLASAPNFRPSFKYYSWHTCLLGLIGTISMMFLISPLFSVVSIILCLSIIILLSFLSPAREQNWGSISQALLFHQVRKYLLLLDARKDHVKFWRPQILLLVSNPRYNCSLIEFVNALKKGGLYVLGHAKEGNLDDLNVDEDPSIVETPDWWRLIDHLKVKAFVEITVARTIREGIQQLVRISGIGAMKPNTIIMGFPDHDDFRKDDFGDETSDFADKFLDERFPKIQSFNGGTECENIRRHKKIEFVKSLEDILKLRKNICVCRNFQQLDRELVVLRRGFKSLLRPTSSRLYIDVWLMDFFSSPSASLSDVSSLFLLQLACVVNMSQRWKKLCLRVFVRHLESQKQADVEASVKHLLQNLRIRAQAKLVNFQELYELAERNSIDKAPQNPIGQYDIQAVSEEYVISANYLIRENSQDTAVSFFYLPRLPQDDDSKVRLIDLIKLLTLGLPPSILVHGIHPVISTAI